jgi:hypothetical protein
MKVMMAMNRRRRQLSYQVHDAIIHMQMSR